MYLLDTNVVSEMRKGIYADPGVKAFAAAVDGTQLFLSVLTVGEIRRGIHLIEARGDSAGGQRLQAGLDVVCADFAPRILTFDLDCAAVWARLMMPDKSHPIDKQIAATALLYDLTLVTRNVKDFGGLGVRIENPFQS